MLIFRVLVTFLLLLLVAFFFWCVKCFVWLTRKFRKREGNGVLELTDYPNIFIARLYSLGVETQWHPMKITNFISMIMFVQFVTMVVKSYGSVS